MGKLIVIGSSIVDLTFYTDYTPTPGQTVLGHFHQGLGGKGFNQAIAAKLSGGRDVHFITSLGSDSLAQPFIDRAKSLEIGMHFTTSPEPTGAASIIVDSLGQNQIVVSLGANAKLEPAVVIEQATSISPDLTHKDVILLQLETNEQVISTSLNGLFGTKILNPAPAAMMDISWLEKVNILTPNETELCQIVGYPIDTEESLKHAYRSLSRYNQDLILITTLGEKGVFVSTCSRDFLVPAPVVKDVIDTSGAGDAFNGAFAAHLADGFKLEDSVEAAVQFASLSVTRKGTSSSFPTNDEFLDYLRSL